MDTEEEIERAGEEVMKETGKSKLEALKMLFSRYESQRCWKRLLESRK